jgi:hypothetical protein
MSLAYCTAKNARKSVPAYSGGVFGFFDFVEKPKHPTPKGSVREPGSLMPIKLTLISHWGKAPGPFLLCFFAATPQKNQNKSIFRGFATPNPPLCKAASRLA